MNPEEWVLRLEKHYYSPARCLPHGAPTSACLIFGSCSGEMQPMGRVDWTWCVLGLCTRGSHLKRRGRWMEGKVGGSEEKENCRLVFVTVQQLDENHYQQQKCCWLIFSCGFEERSVESVLLQPACLSQSVNVRQCVSLSAWNTTGRHA